MKKKINLLCTMILIATLLLLIFNMGTIAQAQVMSTDDVAKSVVQIAIELPDREPFRTMFRDPATGEVNLRVTMGTGMLIGTDETDEFRYCATAWHVVDTTWGQDLPADMRFTPDEVNLYILRARDDYVPVRVYQDLRTSDIAILEIDPAHRLYGYIPLVFGNETSFARGDRVTAIGYPAAAETFSDLTIAQFTDSTTPQGSITRITSVDGVPVIQTDANITGGHSGGPVINEDGVIVGMTAWGVGTELNGFEIRDNIEYAVQVQELTGFLESRNIPFLRAEDAAPEPVVETTPEPVEEAAEPIAQEPEPVEEETAAPAADQDQGQMMLFIGIGAAVLLVIILAVVLTRGKKAAPSAAAPRAAAPPPPSAPHQNAAMPSTQAKPTSAATPVTKAKPAGLKVGIKGISGQFAGQTIDMTGNQLIIGRDPRMAQLVYPQSKDDISRKHLTIRFDEKTQKFILEDSSSNGTFLSSNEKLEPGKPYYLNPGDRFYVADSKEVFELVKG